MLTALPKLLEFAPEAALGCAGAGAASRGREGSCLGSGVGQNGNSDL